MRMLCVCAKGDGYLQVNGKSLRDEALALVIGRPIEEIRPLIEELADAGVFSFDRKNRIYSRRMIRDGKIAIKGKQNADLRWSRHRSQAAENNNENQQPNGDASGPVNGEAYEEPYAPRGSLPTTSTYTDSSRTTDGLTKKLFEAAGPNALYGTPGIEVIKPILDLEAQGCDVEEDILPAVRATVPKMREPLRTWSAGFLRDAIMARKAARLRGQNGPTPAESKEAIWRRQWDWWKKTGEWPGVWGPGPDISGCEIPKELIERWSAET
jgi:hypothetical protein